MSQSDSDSGFGESEDTDPTSRELRTEIVRLEAQLDQLAANVRERIADAAVIQVQLATLEQRIVALEARRRRDARLILVAWIMMLLSLVLSLYTYFTT